MQVNAKAGQVRGCGASLTRCCAVKDCACRACWGRSGRARGGPRRPKEHLDLLSLSWLLLLLAPVALGTLDRWLSPPSCSANLPVELQIDRLVCCLWLWRVAQAVVVGVSFRVTVGLPQQAGI
eukprot:COSAG02_NODE_2791_length_8022_cov_5.437208_2_plen_123_part_00